MLSLSKLNSVMSKLMQPLFLYTSIISALGVMVFLYMTRFHLPFMTRMDLIVFVCLVGSVLLLNHFTFQLPPDGNIQSMDSAVYLACIFVFGPVISLYVLLLSSIIYAFYERRLFWWKHLANFSIYSLMLSGGAIVFHIAGGREGLINAYVMAPYLYALAVYFIINVTMVGTYYFISIRNSFFNTIQSILKEAAYAFFTALIMSLILTALLNSNQLFGLFLFLFVSVTLSYSFKQFFRMYNAVSQKATKDHRTGLYNHGYFEEKLEEELRHAKETEAPFSLAIFDIDDFKRYNDEFGHLKGDQLLEFFSGVLQEYCNKERMVVARYGGEEFSILMPNLQEHEAYLFINNLRKRVNDTYFEGVEVFPNGCLSFSSGIVGYKRDIYDKSQLVDKADQALYYAKAQGKNTVHIYNEQSVLQKSLDIEQDVQEIEQQLRIFLSKDVYTFQHSKRVFRYAVEMAEKLNLSESEKKTLILGALFHDIGKLEIPRDILNKKGKLTGHEWEIVKKHVLWGKEIASTNTNFKELIPLIELHHEKYDGTGYPYGMARDEIPRLARVLTVIDSFDAMTTERPYQPTRTIADAIKEIQRHKGTQFDPHFADEFIELIQKKSHLHFDFSNEYAG